MLFQILNRKTKVVIIDNLTKEQLGKHICCYFHELESYVENSHTEPEKEFLIRSHDPIFHSFIKENRENFTILVKRFQ